MNLKRYLFAGITAIFVVAAVIVSQYRIGSAFEILDGKGVSGFMSLDDNPLLTYFANADSLSLRVLSHGRCLLKDRKLGLSRCHGLYPVISLDLVQAFGKCNVDEHGRPFGVTSRLLGDVDGKLTLQRVVCAYGKLPKVEDDKCFQFPFFPVFCRYPMKIQYANGINGEEESSNMYWDRGVSFKSLGGHITDIDVYPSQNFNTNLIFKIGRVVVGDECVTDLGCIKYSGEASFFVVELENEMFHGVSLELDHHTHPGLNVYLGAVKLSGLESTILVLTMAEGIGCEGLNFCFDIKACIDTLGETKICLKGTLKRELKEKGGS